MLGSSGFKGMYNRTIESRTENRDFDFWEEIIKRCKKEDILPRMESYFVNEVGSKPCPTGTFRNIVDRALGYHRKDFPPFILNDIIYDFRMHENNVDWESFMDKLKLEFDISLDLDEVLNCIYQWMKYNGMYSVHEVFKTTEIDLITFQEGCKKAGTDIELHRIDRIFEKYSIEDDKNTFINYEKITKLFEEKKPTFISRDRYININQSLMKIIL